MTREEAIITLEHYLDYWKMISDEEAFPIDDDIEALQMAIEALKQPEIIYCKDCKWWDREAEDSPMGYCHACKHNHYSRHWEIHIMRTYEEDFFCADAEPKEEEEEEEDE